MVSWDVIHRTIRATVWRLICEECLIRRMSPCSAKRVGRMVSDLPPIFDGIEAVCFDAFGTLVEITDGSGIGVPPSGGPV